MTQQHATGWGEPVNITRGGLEATDHGGRGTPAIDRSVLGEWLAGDDAAIDGLLAVFRESIHAEQERMRQALGESDLGEYAAAAHRLRGAALSMGARALADVAGRLNEAAKSRDGTACGNGLSLLDTHICLVTAEIPMTEPPDGAHPTAD